MTTSYQIALFSHGADAMLPTLRGTILRRLGELGVKENHVTFLNESTVLSRDVKAPIVAAYLSLERSPPTLASVGDLIAQGIMVVPVVPDLNEFSSYTFDEIRKINGMPFSREEDPELERVASVLLEGLSLLRKTRRLFISYRRVETQGVAIQLYEVLDQHGFDVFLDTHSVRPGEPFQDILWHRLADTDVIVLLDSPNFMDSRWTEKELARANSSNVQILQLIWPSNVFSANAAFSRAFPLTPDDFVSKSLGPEARLTAKASECVVTEVESLRARALAARQAYLVQELCHEARNLGLDPQVQPDRSITLEPSHDKFYVAVPAVGVPDAVRYQEIEDAVQRHKRAQTQVVLLYDERGIRDKWVQHLEWLNRQKLRVRSIQVSQAATWLAGLK